MDFAETIRGIFGGQSSQPPPAGEDYASDLKPMVDAGAEVRRKPRLSFDLYPPKREEPQGEELHDILRSKDKVPSPDFIAPPPGLGQAPNRVPSDMQYERPPNVLSENAARGIAASTVEPFGQAGRLATGGSEDVAGDLAGVGAAVAPIGPPGAGKVLGKAAGLGRTLVPTEVEGAMRAAARSGAHPDWIGTRLPTGKKPIEVPGPPIANMAAMRATPDLYKRNVDLVRDYPNMPEGIAANGSTEDVEKAFVDHVKGNLLSLHDKVPQNIRDRSKLWYEGGNRIVKDWAKQYGLKDSAVAGVIAAMSPQKDWFQNVSLAKRVLHTMKGYGDNFYQGHAMTPEMEREFQRIAFPEKGEPKHDWVPMFNDIKGKSLGDIDRMDATPEEKVGLKAMWVRLHDEAHHPSSVNLVTPEGDFGDTVKTKGGKDARIQWGSLKEVAKAIGAIEANGEQGAMSNLMGEKHKVRNFYNNLLDPNGPHGDVTIDTHAVAAGLLRPLSQASHEVAHNFGNSLAKKHQGPNWRGAGSSANTGISGTYPLYAEAYRQAAKERGITPREMQSITWEAARGLFPDTWKNAKNNQLVDSIWKQYRAGEVSIDEARKAVYEAAGGINPPDWHE